jgi:hypothetical protein
MEECKQQQICPLSTSQGTICSNLSSSQDSPIHLPGVLRMIKSICAHDSVAAGAVHWSDAAGSMISINRQMECVEAAIFFQLLLQSRFWVCSSVGAMHFAAMCMRHLIPDIMYKNSLRNSPLSQSGQMPADLAFL